MRNSGLKTSMVTYELSNEQRKYFGLEPIESSWDRKVLTGDSNHAEGILFFDRDTIKRHIISNENEYVEYQYDELTKDRMILLPKTGKGKEKKLTASVLEKRTPLKVYLHVSCGHLMVGNYSSQTTFYSTRWDNEEQSQNSPSKIITDFIDQSPSDHLEKIDAFKSAKRKHIKFHTGDYFCFKLDRTNLGFGRVLLDVGKIRKRKLLDEKHGLDLLMGQPVIVELFAFKSDKKHVDIGTLDAQVKLPADVMMDNLLFYGEYEIIGHREIKDEEFDFPISYGRSIDQRRVVFLQWGLIHKELPQDVYNRYTYTEETQVGQNPFGYYSIGYCPRYDSLDVLKTIASKGTYDFEQSEHYAAKWDLRNPRNKEVKSEVFRVFGLDSSKNYFENSKLTGTKLPSEIIKQL
jgi:hypothetical protein